MLLYLIFKASESAKALKFVKSCKFFKLATSGKFNEFFFDVLVLSNLISRSKFSEIAFTAEEIADLTFLLEAHVHPF